MEQRTERDALYSEAIESWGHKPQLTMVVEELAELTKEVCKTIRSGRVSNGLADECADVEIMLEQLNLLAARLGEPSFRDTVVSAKRAKLERLRTRLADWKRDHA